MKLIIVKLNMIFERFKQEYLDMLSFKRFCTQLFNKYVQDAVSKHDIYNCIKELSDIIDNTVIIDYTAMYKHTSKSREQHPYVNVSENIFCRNVQPQFNDDCHDKIHT